MSESGIERKGTSVSQELPPSPWARSPQELLSSPLSNNGKAVGHGEIHELIIYDPARNGKGLGKAASEHADRYLNTEDKPESANGRHPGTSDVKVASDSNPSDSNSRRGPHGEIIKKHPGGVSTTDYPDGTSIVDTPDTRHTTRPDGTKTVVDKKTGRVTTFVPPNMDPNGQGYRVDQMPGKPAEQHPQNWQPPVKPRWRQKIDDINEKLEEEYRGLQKHPREEVLPPRGPVDV